MLPPGFCFLMGKVLWHILEGIISVYERGDVLRSMYGNVPKEPRLDRGLSFYVAVRCCGKSTVTVEICWPPVPRLVLDWFRGFENGFQWLMSFRLRRIFQMKYLSGRWKWPTAFVRKTTSLSLRFKGAISDRKIIFLWANWPFVENRSFLNCRKRQEFWARPYRI